jgi:hypothetical protein
MNHAFDWFLIVLGAFVIVATAISKSDVYRTHGPGLGRYGPPIEPRWLGKLLLVLVGIALILNGVSAIRHH